MIDLDEIIKDPIHNSVTRDLAERCQQAEAHLNAIIAVWCTPNSGTLAVGKAIKAAVAWRNGATK